MIEYEQRIWKTAIYIRISKNNSNDTLENQRDIINNYLKMFDDIRVCSIKIDDGYSGLNCDRPAFQEMLREIQRGEVDCIVVRDLSRFSRNYIDAGRYIQDFFPSLGVRFISVFERIDLIKASKSNIAALIGFRTLFHEDYLRILSRNIQSSLRHGYSNGKYMSSFSVYGYRKSHYNCYQLELDPVTAETVRNIYQWKLEGMNKAAIAERLEQEGIPSPAEYKKPFGYQTGFQRNSVARWSPVTVNRILTNKIYTGCLEQGKSKKPYFKANNRVQKPQNEWICFEDAHEAIIPLAQFEAVNRLLLMDTRSLPGQKTVTALSGFVRCRNCGKNMIQRQVVSKKKRYWYYVCCGKNQESAPCPAHRISRACLEEDVFYQLSLRINEVIKLSEQIPMLDKHKIRKIKLREDLKTLGMLEEELKLNRKRLNCLDDEKTIRMHTTSELNFLRRYFAQECTQLENGIQIAEARAYANANSNKLFEWIEEYRPYFSFKNITRPLLAYLVYRISVGRNKDVIVEFLHEQEFQFLRKTIYELYI